jgi:hypothetical protein
MVFNLAFKGLILLEFIGAVCYVADQVLPFRGHDVASILLNIGDFLEFLDVLKNVGPLLANHTKSANVT